MCMLLILTNPKIDDLNLEQCENLKKKSPTNPLKNLKKKNHIYCTSTTTTTARYIKKL